MKIITRTKKYKKGIITTLAAFIFAVIGLLSKGDYTPKILPSNTIFNDNLYLVTDVIDGDTFTIEGNKKVRLIGIDAPELEHTGLNIKKECYADESTIFLKNLIENKKVKLVKDVNETDRYGRLLRYVYLEDEFVNELIVKEGNAKSYAYMPDVKLQSKIDQAQKNAKLNKKGMWEACHEQK